MRPTWDPTPDRHRPLITDHAFDRWTYPSTGLTTCMHREDGRMCDRPEEEHAVVDEAEA
jgi:hypothetical protein